MFEHLDNQRYNILLNHKGYMINKNSFRESPSPLFGTKFATGRQSYSDLDFWQTDGQRDFSDGFGQLFLQNPSEFAFGLGLDLSVPRKLCLEKKIAEVTGKDIGSALVTSRELSDGMHLATKNGKVYQFAGNYSGNVAEFSFEDDFETGNLDKWTSIKTGDYSWEIENSVVHAGSYSAKASAYRIFLKKEIAPAIKGTFEGYFRFGETNKSHFPFYPKGEIDQNLLFISASSDGHFKYREKASASYQNFPIDTTYLADTWYKIKIEWDGNLSKFKVWINDVEITAGGITDISFRYIKTIQIYNYSNATMYIDDIIITGTNFILLTASEFPNLKDFYEMRGNQYACRGVCKLLKRSNRVGNYIETAVVFKDIDFEDNFEDGTFNKWTSVKTGDNSWEIETTIVHSGNFCAKATGPPTYLIKKIEPTIKGEIEGYFRFAEVNKHHYPFHLIRADGQKLFVGAASDGHFKYYDGSYHNFPTDTTYLADTWYKIKVKWDGTLHKFWVWIDDVEVTNGGITSWTFAYIRKIMCLNTCSNSEATMYVDGIKLIGDSSGLNFMKLDYGDLGYGFFLKGIKRSNNGETFVPETEYLFRINEEEGEIKNAYKTINQIYFATERALYALLSGGIAVKIADFASLKDANNFQAAGIYSFLIFSVENLGLFFTGGRGHYPTNIHKLNPYFNFTSCKGIAIRGTDAFALIKNETDWYLARCNLDWKKYPMHWSLTNKLDFIPSGIFAYNNILYIVSESGQIYMRDEDKYVSEGYLITSRINAGMENLEKLVREIESDQESFPANTTIKLRFYKQGESDPTYEETFTPGQTTKHDLINPTLEKVFRVGIVLGSSDESASPEVSNLTWTYILEREKARTKKFSFSMLGEITEKLDGSKFDVDYSEDLDTKPEYIYDGKVLRNLWKEIFDTAQEKKALNFVSPRNRLLPGITMQYKGSGKAKVTIDRTNYKITFNLNGIEYEVDTESANLETICSTINSTTNNLIEASVIDVSYNTYDAKNLIPIFGIELSGNTKDFDLGTEVYSVMFDTNYPRLVYLPDAGYINVSLIEV